MKRNLLYFRLYALLALVCFLYGAMQEARRAGIRLSLFKSCFFGWVD